jgi:hypothetical protein
MRKRNKPSPLGHGLLVGDKSSSPYQERESKGGLGPKENINGEQPVSTIQQVQMNMPKNLELQFPRNYYRPLGVP